MVCISKRSSKTGEQRRWWVVTTGHSLPPADLRETFYWRRRIENSYFKQLNHRVLTKPFAVKDPRSFTTMLTLLIVGMVPAKWVPVILVRFGSLRKESVGTEKTTLTCSMVRLREHVPAGWLSFSAARNG